MKRARHTNIVQLLGACMTHGMLLMTLAPHGTLRQRLDAEPPLSIAERYHMARGICAGMVVLHKHAILHLDLKPANILLGAGEVPLISDFGVSVVMSSTCTDTSETDQEHRGTNRYKAPELFKSKAMGGCTYDYPCDVYSFAMLVWELFTAQPPWGGLSDLEISAMHLNVLFGTQAPQRPRLTSTSSVAGCTTGSGEGVGGSGGADDEAGGGGGGRDWEGPAMTPPEVVETIKRCWNQQPAERPPFAKVLERLDVASGQFPLQGAGQRIAAADQMVHGLEIQLAAAEAERRVAGGTGRRHPHPPQVPQLAAAAAAASSAPPPRPPLPQTNRQTGALRRLEIAALATEIVELRHSHAAAVADRDVLARALQETAVEFPPEWTAQRDDGGDRADIEWWRAGRELVSVARGAERLVPLPPPPFEIVCTSRACVHLLSLCAPHECVCTS
jgi:mitogen-activated protein kinase kinase kinase 7